MRIRRRQLLIFKFLWNMLGALLLLPAIAHYLIKPIGAAGGDNTVASAQSAQRA